ncbi:hypothetical protein CLU79DRAFT_760618 [Phycomyces nitens]|nr:hypothetical protein CLU79DRAFT_760618 [Phycomyces nitens]
MPILENTVFDASMLTVQIRSPALQETLSLKIDRDASVYALKMHIQDVHPQKPMASEQRIIHSGKLLNDTDFLRDVLAKTDANTIPTFHLVVKPSLSTSSHKSQLLGESQPVLDQTDPSQYTAIPSAPQTLPLHPQNVFANLPQMIPGGYQVVAINGQYYLAPVLVPATTFPAHTGWAQPLSGYGQPMYHNASQARPQVQPAVQPQPNPPVPGPVEDQRVARNRIVIRNTASIWLALKLIFILFIVCQGASLERIIFFHIIAFVFFLYQTGRLRFVVQRVRAEDPVANRRAVPVPQQQNGGATLPRTPPSTENPIDPQPTLPDEPMSSVEIFKRCAYLFMVSLWPDYDHDPNVAQAFENAM